MENEKDNLGRYVLSDALQKELSERKKARIEIRPGMSPEMRAVVEEANSMIVQEEETLQRLYLTDEITLLEYRAGLDGTQQLMEDLKRRMRY